MGFIDYAAMESIEGRSDVVMEWNICGRENTLYDTYTHERDEDWIVAGHVRTSFQYRHTKKQIPIM